MIASQTRMRSEFECRSLRKPKCGANLCAIASQIKMRSESVCDRFANRNAERICVRSLRNPKCGANLQCIASQTKMRSEFIVRSLRKSKCGANRPWQRFATPKKIEKRTSFQMFFQYYILVMDFNNVLDQLIDKFLSIEGL